MIKAENSWKAATLILLAAGLRLIHLGGRSFRTDEGIIAQLAQRDLTGVWQGSLQNSTPAFFNLQLHYLYQGLGSSQFALSLLPLIYGVLTVYFTYLLISRYVSRQVGLVAALLLAISPYGVFISQELRPYSLMTCMYLAAAYYFLRFLETGSVKFWLLNLVFTVGAVYSHIFAWTILIVENLYFFLYFRTHSKYLLHWFGLQIGVILLFAPTIPATITMLQASGVNPESVSPGKMSLSAFLYMAVKKGFGLVLHFSGGYYFQDLPLRRLFNIFAQPLQGLILLIMIIIPWIFLLGGFRELWRRRVRSDLYLLLLFIIPGAVLLIEGTNPNYYTNASPAFFAISALGWLSLPKLWRFMMGAAYLLMVAVSLGFIYTSPVNTYLPENYQLIAKHLQDHREPQEVVVFWGGKNASHAWNYYDAGPTIYTFPGWTPDNFEIARVDKPRPPQFLRPEAFASMVDSLLEADGRVWFVMQCRDDREIEEYLPALRGAYNLNLITHQPYLNLLEIQKSLTPE